MNPLAPVIMADFMASWLIQACHDRAKLSAESTMEKGR
jgi:hypothetical protein